MSQIFQWLCLNNKPLTKEQRETSNLAREEYLRNQEVPNEEKTTRYYKPYEAPSKFLDVGYDVIHVKGIPVEYWDDAEFDEYGELMEKKFAKLERDMDERIKPNDELFGKLRSSADESEE